MKGRNLLKKNEFYITVIIIVLACIIQVISGQFFTSNNLVDLLRSMIVPGMMAAGLFMVIVSGNIDVSFPYTAMLCMFAVTKWFSVIDYQGPVFLAFLIAGVIGMVLGLLNGVLAAWLKLPTLIITLGTCTIFLGITQGVLQSSVISVLPVPMAKMVTTNLFSVVNGETGLGSSMPVSILFLAAIYLIVGFIMKYTMLGRGIYAVGGDPVAAERAGFNVSFIRIFVFTFMGAIGGITGITQVTVSGMCQINFFDGYEMTIIAAVVLGGANIAGGSGSVIGTFLGVLLMKMISNNLILLGIPTNWSKFMTGILIIAGVSMSAYKNVLAKRRIASNILENGHKEEA
ncbi:ABC transporter permease [Suilimivivens sp.]|jgi:ABC sugar transporter, inner membrane subunit|uniref:ABC transporter permease n=1 Tax=Suilimivivens sp. TaxID=2981669 RepID=UPI0030769F23